MNTPEHDALRDVVAEFCTAETGGRADGGVAARPHDRAQWRRMARIGLPGAVVAEDLGGSALDPVALTLVAEQLGRRVFGGPFLGSAVLAATALGRVGGDRSEALLKGLAAGDTITTLVAAPDDVTVRSGVVLDGTVPVVWSGGEVDRLLVAARTATGVGLFDVDATAPGVLLRPLESLDPTRPAVRLELDGATGELLTDDATPALHAATALGTLVLAAEQLGAMQACLDDTVAYVGTRVQFGRPVGSFQAVQHRLADLHVRVELCRSLVTWSARHTNLDTPSVWPAAALALCSETAELAAAEMIQFHGGIGFTWEHDAHRFARRARVGSSMVGRPVELRRRIAARLDVAPDAADGPADGPAEDDPLRATVRTWITKHLDPDWEPFVSDGDSAPDPAELSRRAGWYATLGDAGWATPTWPEAHGGLGLSADEGSVVVEELARRGAATVNAHWTGLRLAAPALLTHGTDEQRALLLPGIRRSTQRWCQLFSEPGAGSDLASLSTSAVQRDDGRWVVNGQKVWSTFAQYADYGILLARTHPDRPKHTGITFFVLDMSSAGVDVRPLRQMTGGTDFNEVFLTAVEIPDRMRVGAAGDGWRVAMSTLVEERSSLVGRPTVGPGLTDPLIAAARRSGRWAEPDVADELVRALIVERALQMTAVRADAERRASGAGIGAAASVAKLAMAELSERLGMLAPTVAGIDALAWPAGEPQPAEAMQFLAAKAHSLAGGTTEIQRSIIAERVLGLPRDVDPDRGRPWRDTVRSG